MTSEEYCANLILKLSAVVEEEGTIDARHFISMLDLSKDNSKLFAHARKSLKLKKQEIDKAIAAQNLADRRTAELGSNPKTAAQFVEAFMEARGITVNAAKELRTDETELKAIIDGKVISITPELLANKDIRNAHETFKHTARNPVALCLETRVIARELGYTFRDNEMADAYAVWSERHAVSGYRALVEHVAFREFADVDDMWVRFVEAFFEGDTALNIAIFKKFYHQIKRKMNDLPVDAHLMPILENPAQEIGKSSVTNYLIEPIKELTGRANFAQITNDKIIDMWSLSVIVIDEMSGAKNAEAEAVKEIITAPYVMRRPMTTNRFDKFTQKATLIGSSNKPLSDLIRDETGNRRFAPVAFRTSPDWTALETVDFLVLMRSVDENGPDPIQAEKLKLKASQSEARYTSPIEDWFADGDTSIFNGASPLMMNVFTAYNDYQKEAVQPYARLSMKKFTMELRRLSVAKLVPVEMLPRTSHGVRVSYTGAPKMRAVS